MKTIFSVLLTLVFTLSFTLPAYASPDPTWASLPVQKQGGPTNEARYTKAVQRLMMNYDIMAKGVHL